MRALASALRDSGRWRHNMPEKETLKRARQDRRAGKSPSTQAGEFVREEMHHIREGKHGARSTKQAIAIGLSKARRSGVKLGRPPATATPRTKQSAASASRAGRRRTKSTSNRRSRAARRALKREPHRAASRKALARQARGAARRRSPAARRAAAQRAVRTKGPRVRRAAARRAARTRQRRRRASA
jgi:uncharacterized protein DUF6496